MVQPPTDNLYKFMAVIGLAVMGGGTYVPLERYLSLERVSVRVDELYGLAIEPAREGAKAALEMLDCDIAAEKKATGPSTATR